MIEVRTFVFIPSFEVVIPIPNEKYLFGKINKDIYFWVGFKQKKISF
jgi:hypothetical protein